MSNENNDKCIKLMVCGSRSIDDEQCVFSLIDACVKMLNAEDVIIIEGAARGVDLIAKKWATDHNKQIIEFPANWELYGKTAGFRRNYDMIAECDYCLIIWDGKSSGTKHDIDVCSKMNKPYKLVTVNTNESDLDMFI